MQFSKFSPVSLLVGVVFAVILLVSVGKTDDDGFGKNGAEIGIIGFVIGSGAAELFHRIRQGMRQGKSGNGAGTPQDEGKS